MVQFRAQAATLGKPLGVFGDAARVVDEGNRLTAEGVGSFAVVEIGGVELTQAAFTSDNNPPQRMPIYLAILWGLQRSDRQFQPAWRIDGKRLFNRLDGFGH